MKKTTDQFNKIKLDLSRSLLFDLLFLLSILYISIDNPDKIFAKILLIFNILFFAYAVFLYVKSYKEKSIALKNALFSKIYLLLNLFSLVYILYSSLSNTSYLLVLLSVVIWIAAILIAYSVTRYINKRMKNYNDTIKNVLILLVSLLIFVILFFITLSILLKLKLI